MVENVTDGVVAYGPFGVVNDGVPTSPVADNGIDGVVIATGAGAPMVTVGAAAYPDPGVFRVAPPQVPPGEAVEVAAA